MNKTPYTPSTIVKESIMFRIPLYQRPYAWEEAQVNQMLTDLFAAYSSSNSDDYHIGILSVAATSDDRSRFDLIDGQQRITTLMLIGKAVDSLIWNEFLTPDRLHLYGRMGDQAFLDYNNNTECNLRMLETVEITKNFIKDKPLNHKLPFTEYIYNHAAFFLSEVPKHYSLMEKNQQFVRMNNRGKQLEKHEILKDRLLSRIQDQNDQNRAFDSWNDMVECLTGKIGGNNHVTNTLKEILGVNDAGNESHHKESLYSAIVSIPEFLLIALSRCEGQSISPDTDKMLETFGVLVQDADVKIKKFVDVLEEQLKLLKSFFIFLSKDGKYDIGYSTGDNPFSFRDTSSSDYLRAVQSFLHVSTEPHHWMIPAFEWCKEYSNNIDAEKFVKELERIDSMLITGKTRTLSPSSYIGDMTYDKKVSHYWFYRLDYELWKLWKLEDQKDEDVWSKLRKRSGINEENVRNLLRDFRFRKCGSVEHILSQNPEGRSDEQKPDHSFGNLALITNRRNSKLNNSEPESKKAIILRSGYTESLKMLHFLWCCQNTEDAGKKMHDILSVGLSQLSDGAGVGTDGYTLNSHNL
ncbi:MAG: DUF262 domain-containing HNH endonuclease family protein [Deltaproteobacteria bacterium]